MIKKKSNKKGFTIMEMLIVVAIIAVLAAIAIPTFSSALTKSKESADVANIRAAYAEIQVAYLTDGTAYPTDKDGFLGYVDGGLNDEDNLTYTAPTVQNEKVTANGKTTYTADKLVNSKTNTKVFEWSIGDAE